MIQSRMGRQAQFFQLTFEKFFITAIFTKITDFTVKYFKRTKVLQISNFLLGSEKLRPLESNDLLLSESSSFCLVHTLSLLFRKVEQMYS